MVMTRLGENSKMVISGDLEQSDLTGKPNGLWDLTERMKTFEGEFKYIERIKMRSEDIVRHPAVEEILKIYKA
jgi:phosphate starvation-inducible PhoH-like protein